MTNKEFIIKWLEKNKNKNKKYKELNKSLNIILGSYYGKYKENK